MGLIWISEAKIISLELLNVLALLIVHSATIFTMLTQMFLTTKNEPHTQRNLWHLHTGRKKRANRVVKKSYCMKATSLSLYPA